MQQIGQRQTGPALDKSGEPAQQEPMNAATLIAALGPVVGLIALGAVFRKWRRLDAAFWPSAEALAYFVLFPSLWIDSLANAADVTLADAYAASAGCAAIVIGAIVLWLSRPFFKIDHAAFTSTFQGALRFNTYVGLSLAAALFDADGFKTVIVVAAAMSVILNILCVITLSANQPLVRIPLAIVKNPLVISAAAGILLNVFDIDLPTAIGRLFAALADASLPIGLLVVGAALKFSEGAHQPRLVATTSLLKLVFLPAVGFGVAALWGLGPRDTAIVVLFTALPTAPTAYSLARELGGDAPLMARLITLETIVAGLTLPLAIILLDRLFSPFAL